MSDETHAEKIARIDANVQTLMQVLPVISQLDKDSAVNKREHRIVIGLGALLGTPALMWVAKKLGIQIF